MRSDEGLQLINQSHLLCVAPMMDWTDRHCRYFHRQLSPEARLYTEMVTTGALLHGDVPRHLDFDEAEHPVALQLGGSDPSALAHCAKLGEEWGYDEINLNCGCPSERVQNGAFGACLMAEPALVADCVKAMIDAVEVPVTVKHRIGLDRNEDYAFVRDFVGTVADAGCSVFIVHARNAWLKGLSPKENREVPPLRYDVVGMLKRDFPTLTFVINGGLATPPDIGEAMERFDGVMIGRAAYHDPWLLAQLDRSPGRRPATSRSDVVAAMKRYCMTQMQSDRVALRSIVRHMLGLYHGRPAAKTWRRMLSDATLLHDADASLLDRACEAVENPAPMVRQATEASLLRA
jgi:tRNA-dihydrouridine synthase A